MSHINKLLSQLPSYVLVQIIDSLAHHSGVEIKYAHDVYSAKQGGSCPAVFASSPSHGTFDLAVMEAKDLPEPETFIVSCVATIRQRLQFKVKAHTPEEAIEFAVRREGIDGKFICEDFSEHLETVDETEWEVEP